MNLIEKLSSDLYKTKYAQLGDEQREIVLKSSLIYLVNEFEAYKETVDKLSSKEVSPTLAEVEELRQRCARLESRFGDLDDRLEMLEDLDL